jgi:serine/threonine protein kinase
MAPEIILDYPYTRSVDWWALGILLYEMLTAQQAFQVRMHPIPSPEIPSRSRSPGMPLAHGCALLRAVMQVDNEDQLYEAIQTKEVRFTPGVTPDARAVCAMCMPSLGRDGGMGSDGVLPYAMQAVRGFLTRDPHRRLGCKSDLGTQEIRQHAFFADIDWDRLASRAVLPPFIPAVDAPVCMMAACPAPPRPGFMTGAALMLSLALRKLDRRTRRTLRCGTFKRRLRLRRSRRRTSPTLTRLSSRGSHSSTSNSWPMRS